MTENKPFWQSKTFWANILVGAAGIFVAVADHLTAGGAITASALINIILRFVTNKGITL